MVRKDDCVAYANDTWKLVNSIVTIKGKTGRGKNKHYYAYIYSGGRCIVPYDTFVEHYTTDEINYLGEASYREGLKN